MKKYKNESMKEQHSQKNRFNKEKNGSSTDYYKPEWEADILNLVKKEIKANK